MITKEVIQEQLEKIGFNTSAWGRTEVSELPNIILPDEEIKECVNGFYEGGFALLVATNIRVLLVDKKPLNYLTVEDLRFDMINEIDYSHRLLGARISISTGSKNLKFTSVNQPRLRQLIGHVQHCMAEAKIKQSEHQEGQNLHLEQINQQLQTYLLAQHRQQVKLQEQLARGQDGQAAAQEEVKPSPQLSDYLYAQGLLAEYQAGSGRGQINLSAEPQQSIAGPAQAASPANLSVRPGADDLYEEGVREIFGSQEAPAAPQPTRATAEPAQQATYSQSGSSLQQLAANAVHYALEINPLRIAYSKLPMAMRNRKFGRPSFHAHSAYDDPLEASLPPQPSVAGEY